SRATAALDIGANDGWYALYFASRPNVEKVFACEPTSALQRTMRENFELNDRSFVAKVEFVPKFIGDRDDQADWCSIDRALRPRLPAGAGPGLMKIDVD